MSMARLFPVTALAPSASLVDAFRVHWREYLMEGTEISALMLITCLSGTLLYSRDSPLGSLAFSRALRSLLMGTAVAIAAFLIITSPLGRRSGAHMNPAITASFFWLGRVHRWDAAFYIAAHFGGAVAGVLVARQILGMRLSAPPVQYLITVPGMYGSPAAMLAEFGLSAVLFSVVLYASNHRFLVRFTPVFVAVLTVLYYGVSSSIAGYSVNPARSFASALFAWVWRGIWIYFIAPVLGMLTAATIYVRIMGPNNVYCAKIFHDLRSTCPFPCRFVHLYRQGERRV
jgi:aquaporin Z